jgi:hypothetical protein
LKRPLYPASNVRTDECRRRVIRDRSSRSCQPVDVLNARRRNDARGHERTTGS